MQSIKCYRGETFGWFHLLYITSSLTETATRLEHILKTLRNLLHQAYNDLLLTIVANWIMPLKKLHPFLPVSYMPNITNNNQQLTHKSIPTEFIFFHMHQINIPYLV